MTKYIDKSALVAEIQERIKKYATINVGGSKELDALYGAKCHALNSILSFLDTIEVKEVDLETFDKRVTEMWGRCAANPNDTIACLHIDSFIEIARHFFELGIKAQKGAENLEEAVDDAKDLAMRDMAWNVHVMISEGKSISEIDHYVCGICDF